MKQHAMVALVLLGAVGCVDTGPVPFHDGKLFTGGKGGGAGFSNGGTKSGGGSGGYGGGYGGYGGSYGGAGGYGGGYGGYGGGYGGSGGYSGGGGCKGGAGTPCQSGADCCQVDQNGDTCVLSPIYQCAAICYSSSQCSGNCCVQLQGQSYGACIINSTYTCMP